MAKSKWPKIKDHLPTIERWAKEGLTEKQMCNNLEVGKTAWSSYKNKYPELKEALKRGKEPLITELFNALVQRAKGFEREETKTYTKQDGDKTIVYQEKITKYYAPDVGACAILLKNKDRDKDGKAKWSNDPAKVDIDKELLKLKKEIESLKNF